MNKNYRRFIFLLLFCVFNISALTSLKGAPPTSVTIYASTNDADVRNDGTEGGVSQTEVRVGGASNVLDAAMVFPFQLPALSGGEYISSANFEVQMKSAPDKEGNVDMYGLPYRSSDAVVCATDFYQGTYGGDANATAIQDDFATLNMPAETLLSNSTTGKINLADYINAQYAAGAQAGDYIFIRLNPDILDVPNYKFWRFYTADSPDKPALILEITTPVAVTGVSLSSNSLELELDETANLVETITPGDASDQSVTWSSSNNAIATVDGNGAVKALSSGQATITVTTNDGGFTDDCNITVNCPVLGIPGGIVAAAGSQQVTLSWNEVPDVDGYDIRYGIASGGPYNNTVPVDGSSTTNKVISGLTDEQIYYFVILSKVSNCFSNASAEISVRPTSYITEFIGPNVYISTVDSWKNLGVGASATRIQGQPSGFNGYLVPLSFVIDISAPNAQGNLDACLTFSYDGEDLPEGINMASLDLYRFDEGLSKWVKMNGILDMNNKTVTLCHINEFSKWTLAGSIPESVPLANWGIILVCILIFGVLIHKFYFS